jgi:hypothetical protein
MQISHRSNGRTRILGLQQLPTLQKLEIRSKMGGPRRLHIKQKIDTDAKTEACVQVGSSCGDDIYDSHYRE